MVGKLSSYLNQRWKIFNRPIIGKKICHYPRISLFLWIQLHFFILCNNVLIVIEVSSENIDFEFNLIGEMRGGRSFHISFNSPLHRIVRTCRGLGRIKLEKSPRERERESRSSEEFREKNRKTHSARQYIDVLNLNKYVSNLMNATMSSSFNFDKKNLIAFNSFFCVCLYAWIAQVFHLCRQWRTIKRKNLILWMAINRLQFH